MPEGGSGGGGGPGGGEDEERVYHRGGRDNQAEAEREIVGLRSGDVGVPCPWLRA